MSRYSLECRGDVSHGWGPYQVVDANIGSNKPIASVHDPDVAKKIVDLLNEDEKK